ncbi:uncharacterized protein LOC131255396 [Magnolia sinica]|uniref:uncharacterized protein LOC131255396 n=1 Tax=Magnolia sinica TaxID=86752 RepID=UPI0026589D13|nr:uncharacterized protein LOC131255396 [Magnolia sinica]
MVCLLNSSRLMYQHVLLGAKLCHEYLPYDNILLNYAIHYNRVTREPMLEEWTSTAELCDRLHDPVRIAMVGKYTGLSDSYLSVLKGADGVLVLGALVTKGCKGKS